MACFEHWYCIAYLRLGGLFEMTLPHGAIAVAALAAYLIGRKVRT